MSSKCKILYSNVLATGGGANGFAVQLEAMIVAEDADTGAGS